MYLLSDLLINLPQWLVNHIASFVGSMLYILILVLKRYNNKLKKDEVGLANWVGFIILLLIGQFICLIQEFVFEAYVVFFQENGWDWYYDLEEFFSVCVGMLGIHLVSKAVGLGRSKINNS